MSIYYIHCRGFSMHSQNHAFPRPRIFISRCIEFEACRWNGAMIACDFVKALKPFIEPVTRCPEAAIGLGIPRDPIRLVYSNNRIELYQPATKRFITGAMNDYCNQETSQLGTLDGAILKEKSPSCGNRDVKIYSGIEPSAPQHSKGIGFWANALMQAYPSIPIENEGRLNNFSIREHFYTAIFTYAAFREAKALGTIKSLIDFQSCNKLLFMAYNQSIMRELGRITANHSELDPVSLFKAYESRLVHLFKKIPRRGSMVNVMLHSFGYFSDKLEARERSYFLELLTTYHAGRIPLSACLSVLKAWIERFDEPYLRCQTFFRPYPEELIDITDSGKGAGSIREL